MNELEKKFETFATTSILVDRNTDWTNLKESMPELYNEIRQALTPPTTDEVCEALSEYWGNPVNYDEKHNLFEMYVGDNIWKPIEVLRLREHAPHLITMIGRFYEKEVKE